MSLRASSLVGGSLVVGMGATGALPPDVPWWGQLIMVIVSAALAFFGGRAAASDGR